MASKSTLHNHLQKYKFQYSLFGLSYTLVHTTMFTSVQHDLFFRDSSDIFYLYINMAVFIS